MIGAEVRGDAPGVLRLVEAPLVESDRERLDGSRGQRLGHHRHDRARVDPAAEERAERDVADQAPADGCREGARGTPRRTRSSERGSASASKVEIPVLLDRRPAVAPAQHMAAGQLPDAREDRVAASGRTRAPDSGRGSRGRASAGSAGARAATSARSRRGARRRGRRSRAASCRSGRARAGARRRARPRARTRTCRSGARRTRAPESS